MCWFWGVGRRTFCPVSVQASAQLSAEPGGESTAVQGSLHSASSPHQAVPVRRKGHVPFQALEFVLKCLSCRERGEEWPADSQAPTGA